MHGYKYWGLYRNEMFANKNSIYTLQFYFKSDNQISPNKIRPGTLSWNGIV
jgi:hypothetical protein